MNPAEERTRTRRIPRAGKERTYTLLRNGHIPAGTLLRRAVTVGVTRTWSPDKDCAPRRRFGARDRLIAALVRCRRCSARCVHDAPAAVCPDPGNGRSSLHAPKPLSGNRTAADLVLPPTAACEGTAKCGSPAARGIAEIPASLHQS